MYINNKTDSERLSKTLTDLYAFAQSIGAITVEPPAPTPTPPVDYQHARDIPDDVFLDAIRATRHEYKPGTMPSGNDHGSATRWHVDMHLGGLDHTDTLVSDVPGVPAKVTLAKARRLIKRGLIDGCACGCRGDYQIKDGT